MSTVGAANGISLARPNVFEVDLGAIAHNVAIVRQRIGDAWLYAALKADAYGYGLLETAQTVLDAGADALAVGDIGAGIQLRRSGIQAPILVYPGTQAAADAAAACVEHELIATVYDDASLAAVLERGRGKLEVFLKVDTGLQRLGYAPDAAAAAARALQGDKAVRIAGVYTHLHVPEDPVEAGASIAAQFARFRKATAAIGPGSRRMVASSRVLARFPEMVLDAVDPGRALYGIPWRGDDPFQAELRPAFGSLRTKLLQVKVAGPGPHAAEASGLGVIPLGRRDGLPNLSSGEVLVHGRRVKLLGPPALEHSRLALDQVREAREGDEVVVIGRQGREEITVREVLAAHQDAAPTALALQVGAAVARAFAH